MADKKKKKVEPKKTKQPKTAKKSERSKIKRVEDIKNPKLPKEQKIPKGVSRTIISDKGNIIMTITESDLTGKKPTQRAASPKKPVKPAVAKKADKKLKTVKALKHDSSYESGTDEGKIIVINGKKNQKQVRRGRKKLMRVASPGGYTAWDGRTGKTFATEREAKSYAADLLVRTGEIIRVTRTQRIVTHTFRSENETEK